MHIHTTSHEKEDKWMLVGDDDEQTSTRDVVRGPTPVGQPVSYGPAAGTKVTSTGTSTKTTSTGASTKATTSGKKATTTDTKVTTAGTKTTTAGMKTTGANANSGAGSRGSDDYKPTATTTVPTTTLPASAGSQVLVYVDTQIASPQLHTNPLCDRIYSKPRELRACKCCGGGDGMRFFTEMGACYHGDENCRGLRNRNVHYPLYKATECKCMQMNACLRSSGSMP